VKLYNGTAAPIDLSQYSLWYGGQNYGGPNLANPTMKLQLNGTIPANGCFIVGGPLSIAGVNGTPAPVFDQSIDFNPDIENSGDRADAVGLFKQTANVALNLANLIDTVIYGTTNSDFVGPGTGNVKPPVSVGDAPAGSSIRRKTKAMWEINATPNSVPCVVITQ